ncbi:MAG: CoA transferase [Actinobacteria bacterium]|nr:CoA transferase [Actinomycetota bacterium]
MVSALRGVRIAAFSRVLAGPYATMLLGDMGATVVKIERPEVGDDTRSWGPPFDSEGRATYFDSVNRNKLGVTADLSSLEGREKAMAIIAESDVLVENFAVGTMEKFGLGYEQLKDEFPHLIYCSISGFGSSEKGRALPGYDLLVQAMSGLMSVTGPDAQHPTKVGVALVDVIAGLHTALGITSALVHRAESGEGQKIEINLLSSTLSAMVNQSGAYAGAGVIPEAMGNAHPSIAPYEVYPTKDKQIAIAVGNDSQFVKFCQVLGIEASTDQRFATNTSRVANRIVLNVLLTGVLTQKSAAEWIDELTRVGVPAGPINTIEEAVKLAESLDLNPIISIKDFRDGHQSKSIANPIKFSKTPVEYPLGPPSLGMDD